MLAYFWLTVYDVGRTVTQRWPNVSCLLDMPIRGGRGMFEPLRHNAYQFTSYLLKSLIIAYI